MDRLQRSWLKLSDPEGWINDIEAMVKAAEAEGNQGIYERLKYLPTLIEKIYRE